MLSAQRVEGTQSVYSYGDWNLRANWMVCNSFCNCNTFALLDISIWNRAILFETPCKLFTDDVRVASNFCNIYTKFCENQSFVSAVATRARIHTAGLLRRLFFLKKRKEAKQKFYFFHSLSLFLSSTSEQFLAESWNVFWLWQYAYILCAFRPCSDLEAEYCWRQVTFCCTGCCQVLSESFRKSVGSHVIWIAYVTGAI